MSSKGMPSYLSAMLKKSDRMVLASQKLKEDSAIISTGSVTLDWALGGGLTGNGMNLMWGPPGCHAKGTKILKYDGNFINVEDVQVGDMLMGPDSRPRRVLELARGREMMYEISPTRGSPFIVNGQHILSLMETSRNHHDNIVNISVNEFLEQSNTFRHHFGLYYADTISFENNEELPIDPYMLGVWLGDGTSASPQITSADPEIAKYIYEFAEKNFLKVRVGGEDNPRNSTCRTYTLSKAEDCPSKWLNPFTAQLRKLDLLDNKHIPKSYLTSSVEDRLSLLAGLIDTDGDSMYGSHCSSSNVCTKWPHMAEEINYLARSLGFFSEIKEIWNRAHKNMEKKKYYRVSIVGDLSRIPTKIVRKQFTPRNYSINKLERVTTFQVRPIGIDDYYGFQVNEDHLYVMENFIVTHNSGKSTLMLKLMAESQKKNPDKYAIQIDSEYAFDAKRAEQLGVNLDKLILFQSNTFEHAVAPVGKMANDIIANKDICFIGLDSVKGMSSVQEQSQMDEGKVDSAANAFGGIAKSVNPALNILNRIAHEAGVLVVLANHANMNMDPMTSKYTPYTLTGGQKLKHLCSSIVFLGKVEGSSGRILSDVKDVNGKEIMIGSTIRAKVGKTRLTVEGKHALFNWNLETGEFEDKEMELVQLGLALGVLWKEGTGTSVFFGPKEMAVKAGNSSKFAELLKKDPNLYAKILAACNAIRVTGGGENIDFTGDTNEDS